MVQAVAFRDQGSKHKQEEGLHRTILFAMNIAPAGKHLRALLMRGAPDFGTMQPMLDDFDLALLEEVQRDDGRTAEELAKAVPLSPSAIARRLRRLRCEGWIARTIGLISSRMTDQRLRAVVLVQLSEHADRTGKEALLQRLRDTDEVQFSYEISGTYDLMALLSCETMNRFVDLAEELFASDATVRRYETSFVKRELKFAPFVPLRSS